jgi:hypothetical protein
LDSAIYSDLVLEFILSGNGIITPSVDEFRLYALQTGGALPGATLEFESSKIIGTDGSGNTMAKNLYNLEVLESLGIEIFEDIESGEYLLDSITPPTGYVLRTACAAEGSRAVFSATTDNFVTTLWRDTSSTTNSLLVRAVTSSGDPIPGLDVEIDNDVVIRRGVTDPCGVYVFSDVPAGDLQLTFSGSTIITRSVNINASGITDHEEVF